MKRSGFKFKPRKPLKRTRFIKTASRAKKRINPIKPLKDRLWVLCREITRKRYEIDKQKYWICYTCNKVLMEARLCHTGHCIPSSKGVSTRYDLDNLRIQCYDCNINKGGMGAVFFDNLTRDLGKKRAQELLRRSYLVQRVDAQWYESKIAEYESLVAEINAK